MKKILLIPMRRVCLIVLLAFGITGKLFSQTITISGASPVAPGAQETYSASFNYSLSPYTTLTWSVTGGTIDYAVVNPTAQSIYCTVTWDNDFSGGSVSLYEDMNSVTGEKPVDICGQADGGPPQTICSGGSVQIGIPGVPGYSYSWTPTTGLNNPNIPQPIASPTTTTIYTVTMQGNGCPVSLTSVTVTVNQRVSFSGNITYGCQQIIQQIIPNSVNYFCSFWECGGSTTLQSDEPTGNEWYVNGVHITPPGGNISGLGQVYIVQNGKILNHSPSTASGGLTEFQFQLKNSVWGCEELSSPTTVIYGLTFHPNGNWMGFYKPNYTLNVSTPWNYTYGPGTIYTWNIPNTTVTQSNPAAPQATVFFPSNVSLSGITGTVTISNSPYCNGTYPINFEYNPQLRSINEPEEKKSIVAYPNPATTQITIKSDEAITEIEIFDINTVISYLKKKIGGNNNVTLDINSLKPGIYLCKVVTKTKTEFLKMQILR
ncbi:MAG TPA: T9SS type A sorting domain-containing protein [Chitinophagaceae bacterium]|nr:T9SS type A sorting domain-containing protein [Chitinophagaceae bacterium]